MGRMSYCAGDSGEILFPGPAGADWQNLYELLDWSHLQDLCGGGFALSAHCVFDPLTQAVIIPILIA